MARKYLLYVLSFGLFVTSFYIVLSDKVSATSAYDEMYQATDYLYVGADDGYNDGYRTYHLGNKHDITTSWSQYMLSDTGAVGSAWTQARANSFTQALSTGRWAVSQLISMDSAGKRVYTVEVYWTEDNSMYLDWTLDYRNGSTLGNNDIYPDGNNIHMATISPNGIMQATDNNTVYLSNWVENATGPLSNNFSDTQNGYVRNLITYIDSSKFNYPAAYAGVEIADLSTEDSDNDGLNAAQENAQGTSDDAIDTDGDGLDDKTESIWNTNRDAQFCDTSTTPYTCAYPDPITKDVYVEVDWMHNGTTSYKPSATQIGLVSDAFAAKGIKFHADTGQYGGGNELSTYTAPLSMHDSVDTDFFDYKSANFASLRQGIWRYMILGYNYSESPTSSGATYTGSDSLFLSYGYIEDNQFSFEYMDFDTAIAGTLIHEIGHSLCLSNTTDYSNQDASCIYSGVESGSVAVNDYPNYASSMNYTRQMGMVDYSTGQNGGLVDHDDWSAIAAGMSDFAAPYIAMNSAPSEGTLGSRRKEPRLAVAITTDTAKKLKQKGLLRSGKATWRHIKLARHQ